MASIQRVSRAPISRATTAAFLVLVFCTSSTTAAPGDTTLISVGSGGQQANGPNFSAALSGDGRFVAFESLASNLVPDDTNGRVDVFVRDRVAGTTTRVSVAGDGTDGNEGGFYPAISGDGRYVAFVSGSDNLVPDDTNNEEDVFLHDRQTGETTRVSLDSAGQQRPYECREIAISADGRVVAFLSNSWTGYHIFVKDLQTGQLRRASVSSAGTHANGLSESPVLSGDGRYVAFASYANNLVPGDTNTFRDIFVHDRLTRVTTRVNVSSEGKQADIAGGSFSISTDGRYVAFSSPATNLVAGDTNFFSDVFVHDRQTGETTRVSVDGFGRETDRGSSDVPTLSGDGRFVAFGSGSRDLVANDTNNRNDVFVHDQLTGTTRRVSLDSDGNQANDHSGGSVLNADGTLVVFISRATNLAISDINDVIDIFARELDPDAPTTYTCDGIAEATIIGTDGNDTLAGTAGPDVIVGLEGDDTINGLGGDDLICGDGIVNEAPVIAGNDTLYGDAGNDQLVGSDGFDVLFGGPGNDLLRGNGNADELAGEAGNDDLRGGAGPDHLDGGPDVDTLDGGSQEDTCVNGETLLNCP
jgi:Tol biopolymer transport system component